VEKKELLCQGPSYLLAGAGSILCSCATTLNRSTPKHHSFLVAKCGFTFKRPKETDTPFNSNSNCTCPALFTRSWQFLKHYATINMGERLQVFSSLLEIIAVFSSFFKHND
jgi:hypothetical protein